MNAVVSDMAERIVLRQDRSVGIRSLDSAALKLTFFWPHSVVSNGLLSKFKAISTTGLEKHFLSNTGFIEVEEKESLSL